MGRGEPYHSLGAFPLPPGSPGPGPTLRPSSLRRRLWLFLLSLPSPALSPRCRTSPSPPSSPSRPPLPPLPRLSRRLGTGVPHPRLPHSRSLAVPSSSSFSSSPTRSSRTPQQGRAGFMVCPILGMVGLEIAPLPRGSPPPRCSSFP